MEVKTRMWSGKALALAGLMFGLMNVAWAQGQDVSEEDVAEALRQGGYIIVMSHGDARRNRVDDQPLEAAPSQEQELTYLSDPGIEDARAVGEALRRLEVPLGEVLTSPAEEAVQTARVAGFDEARTERMLDNGGESNVAWLRQKVSEPPREGTNTLLITHDPVILRAFPYLSFAPDPGEVLIIDPRAEEQARLLTRVKVENWENIPS